MRLKIPFQIKVYALIFLLFAVLMQITMFQIDRMISNKILEEEKKEFKGLRTLFYNLLSSQVEAMENEAFLLSELQNVQQYLKDQNTNDKVLQQLKRISPRIERWPVIVFTDMQGNLLSGRVNTHDRKEPVNYNEQFLKKFQPTIDDIMHSMHEAPLVRYKQIEQDNSSTLFVLCSVIVRNLDDYHDRLGIVTLGFAIDEAFAYKLRSGSEYHIGFVWENEIVSTTLIPTRERDLRDYWERTSNEIHKKILNDPLLESIYGNRYLIYSSDLPTEEDNWGYYLILKPLENTLSSLQQLRQSVYWVSLIIFCATLVVAYYLARGVTAPVRKLAETVSRITEGDYSVKADITTGDELETLGREINVMVNTLKQRDVEIQDYVRQIEEWNKQLESKVARRTQDLEEKNVRLRMISEELGRAYAQIDDELKVVGEFQKRLLPSTQYDREDISIHSLYLPNGRAGGDYYDFIRPVPHKIFFLIADVSGHGTPAAFIMSITRAIAHSMINRESTTAEVTRQLSNTLLETVSSGEFITMFLGCLDFRTQQLTYSCAGHPSPLLLRKDSKTLEELNVDQGLPMGIMKDAEYDEVTIQVNPGDRLLLFTDGIVEASNEQKNQYGLGRLEEVMINNREFSLDDLLEIILQDLTSFVQKPLDIEPLDDDVTLVAIDFKPVAVSSSVSLENPAF